MSTKQETFQIPKYEVRKYIEPFEFFQGYDLSGNDLDSNQSDTAEV